MKNNGLHVVIFCKDSYAPFLPYCAESIRQNVNDQKLSFSIVSNSNQVLLPGYKTITDAELWSQFDPTGQQYKALIKKLRTQQSFSWFKQQILKLHLHYWFTGNILVVDADLVFLKAVNFLNQDGTTNLFTAIEFDSKYFEYQEALLDLPKQVPETCSFITDFGFFNSQILTEIEEEVKRKNSSGYINSLISNLDYGVLSEFELYGNYVVKNHKATVTLIDPIEYRMSADFNWGDFTPSEFLLKASQQFKNYYQCFNVL